MYFHMRELNLVTSNAYCYNSALKACVNGDVLNVAKVIHSHVINDDGLGDESHHGGIHNAVIDMYVKLGSIEDAQNVFDRSQQRDVVTWSAMMMGYAEQSNYKLVLENFHKMQVGGIKPDGVTFSCLFAACRHLGEVHEGYVYFKAMQKEYGIIPTMEHWNSLVDLLGGSGYLNEADNMLKGMPFDSNSIGWLSLLSHCKTHGAIELGRKSLCKIDSRDDEYATGLVLLWNIHDDVGMWREGNMIKDEMKCKNVLKKPGKAFIEIANKVQAFTVGDKSHERSDDMLAKVKRLFSLVQRDGYMPCFT